MESCGLDTGLTSGSHPLIGLSTSARVKPGNEAIHVRYIALKLVDSPRYLCDSAPRRTKLQLVRGYPQGMLTPIQVDYLIMLSYVEGDSSHAHSLHGYSKFSR